MGARGPVPKRSSERRRRNKDSKPQKAPPSVASARVQVPPVSRHWHPIAKAWFKSLAESGQAQFFEPSDWQAARMVAEEITDYRKAPRSKRSAMRFNYIWAAMTDLLTTEGARRRVRLEIERDAAGDEMPAGVVALSEYRKALSS